ncbi:CPBP family intramembrane metalloprotease [Candidatus Saccharibacteria bacterium]|nr:CPBP family intramembrane metalloprotease [Candidatus Saccharibacteria bacterium]
MKKSGGKKNKNPWWMTVLYVLGLSAFVFAAVVGVEFLISLFISFVLVNVISVETLTTPLSNSIFSVISYGLSLLVVVVLPPLLFKDKIAKISRERLGLRGLPTWTDVGLAPVGYIVSILIASGLTAVFNLVSWFNASEAQDLGYSYYMQGWERGLAFVMLAVFAPIVEEIIFRGWLYGKLRVKIPKWVAILVTSLLFGLVHLQWNVGITVFSMSVVNCILREVTGTIYAGMLVHMLNNGIAFYLVYVMGMG